MEIEQKKSEVSMATAITIVLGVVAAMVVLGVIVGNLFFWTPAEPRTMLEKAFNKTEQTYKNNPKDRTASLAYAVALSENSKKAEAEKLFNELYKKYPKDHAVLLNYALFKRDNGKKKEAKTALEALLKRAPYFTIANVQYGIILREEGKYEQALTYIDNALKFEPGAADILVEKAKIYIGKKDNTKAKECLNKALGFVPNYEEAQKLLKELK